MVLVCPIGLSAQEPSPHVGVVLDWSAKHVMASGGLQDSVIDLAKTDARIRQTVIRRNLYLLQQDKLAGLTRKRSKGIDGRPLPLRPSRNRVDWSVSLGTGTVAQSMSPAKFSFDINANPSCSTDYVVYGLNVAGVTGGQANLVGLNNLYSGVGASATLRNSPNGAREAGTTVTITTTAAHGFATGNTVQIAGVGVAGYNGIFVITVTGTTTFTYTDVSGLGNSGGGTATLVTGICGKPNPTFFWAYNGSTSGGSVLTSTAVSQDGTKVAYVESTASSSIFHVLTWKQGEGTSATASAAPPQTGACTASTSCLVSVTYSSTATSTLASPWIDYTFDKAYVGSDDGKIYRISCVFHCALNTNPAVDWTFTLPVAGTAGPKPIPAAPVLDSTNQRLIVGDSLGELWSINIAGASPVLAAGPLMVGGGGCTAAAPPGRTGGSIVTPCTASGASFGITDGVLLDGSTGKLFAFSGNDGTAGSSAVVLQASTLLTGVVRAHIGLGSVGNTTTNVDIHTGTFDNNYFNGLSTGLLFMCGTNTTDSSPWHWKIGFASYPTMDSTATAIVARGFNPGNPCTPYDEVFNPNTDINPPAGDHDMLVSGVIVSGGTGYVITNDISGGTIPGALATNTRPTGPSAIVIDNVSVSAQAASVYFSTLGNDPTCGAGVHCAVKLTQVGLQ